MPEIGQFLNTELLMKLQGDLLSKKNGLVVVVPGVDRDGNVFFSFSLLDCSFQLNLKLTFNIIYRIRWVKTCLDNVTSKRSFDTFFYRSR